MDIMLLFLFFLSNPSATIILDRKETKGTVRKKNRLANTTDYCESSQTKEKTKWNQLNKIKENKNSFETWFKPICHKIET